MINESSRREITDLQAFKVEQFEKVVIDTVERSTLLVKNCTHKLKNRKTAIVGLGSYNNIFYVCQNCQQQWTQKTGCPPAELLPELSHIGRPIAIHKFDKQSSEYKLHYIDCE